MGKRNNTLDSASSLGARRTRQRCRNDQQGERRTSDVEVTVALARIVGGGEWPRRRSIRAHSEMRAEWDEWLFPLREGFATHIPPREGYLAIVTRLQRPFGLRDGDKGSPHTRSWTAHFFIERLPYLHRKRDWTGMRESKRRCTDGR